MRLFVYLCYRYIISIWRLLTDWNISPLANLLILLFQRGTGSIKYIIVKITTEMGNLNQTSKVLCTHYHKYLMDYSLYMIIYISLLWVYHLKMESGDWPKYITTRKSCHFNISKWTCIWKNNQLTVTLPIEMGEMSKLGKVFCTNCPNSLNWFCSLYEFFISL